MPDNPGGPPLAGNNDAEQQAPANGAQQIPPGLINERTVAAMLQITTGRAASPTPGQVEKMLGLFEKNMDYQHKENMAFLPKDILTVGCYVLALLILLSIFILCVFFAKEYLGEIVSGFLGLAAGGGLGYGFGMRKNNKGGLIPPANDPQT